jgi:hypothetical protein
MLMNAAADEHGIILAAKHLSGTHFSAGRKEYEVAGQREIARHQAAVEELINHGLIEDVGHKGEVFQVTHEGFEALDRNESLHRKPA